MGSTCLNHVRFHMCCRDLWSQPRIKISVNTDISVIGFYGNIGNIGNIGKISVDIFTQISVIKIFHILII